MIRLLLNSRDLSLQNLLASTPGITAAIDSSPVRVRDLMLRRKYDIVVLDLANYFVSDQLDFLDELHRLGAPVVVLTDDDCEKKRELAGRGVEDYLEKPLDVAELLLAIRKALELAMDARQRDTGSQQTESTSGCGELGCGELIGSSTASRAVYDMIRRVAALDVFVLITGENGTGKELIARAIHSLGDRAPRPFVAVSCGAIPESLIESELFGSEKGAFTGASTRRAGYFEKAAEGTLLLDEIGELSPHTQTRLLRVLQQREFMRLGSSAAIPLRARMLFATNRNLKEMVEAGTFREDLYYRLNVVGIHARPLRERREDIPQLAQHFLARYGRSYRKPIANIDSDAIDLLCRYAWPGNVRELENVIQRAIVLSDNDRITAWDLPEGLRQDAANLVAETFRSNSFEDQLRDYKVRLAVEAVKECNGNKTLAAQSLNISRTYLHRLIREPAEDGTALMVA